MIIGRRLEGSSSTWTRTNRKSYDPSFPCLNCRRPSSSDNERPSGPRRPPPFLNDDGDDEEDELEVPMTVDDNRQHDRSSSASASSSAPAATVNPFRQPTAFAAPNPTTSSGPTFYYKDKTKTPIHAATSTCADGTSMFCVEGYVNTPELSAGRGGGLSQGLPANGPYKSLFRAGSRSESRANASNHQPAPTSAPAPTSVSTSKKRSRKPSPLIASMSPASPVVQLDPISATRSPPVVSTNASSSSSQPHIVIDPRVTLERNQASGKGKQRETLPPEAPGNGSGNGEGSEQRYERGLLPSGRQPSERPCAERHEPESAVQDRPRNVQK
ncbi:hypothetical protein V8E52_001213, partial [Russula decolorans]